MSDIEKNNTSISTLNELKDKLKQAISSQNKLYNESIMKVKDNKNAAERIKQLKTWQSQLDQDLKNFDNDTKQYDKIIQQTKNRLKEIDKSISKIRHTLAVSDVVGAAIRRTSYLSVILQRHTHGSPSHRGWLLCRRRWLLWLQPSLLGPFGRR